MTTWILGYGCGNSMFGILTTTVKTPLHSIFHGFWARICWQVVLGWHWHMCYKRNLDRHGKSDLSHVLKMLPSCFSFPKPEHKPDECARWCPCRVWQTFVLSPWLPVRAGREKKERKRLFLCCPLNICLLREEQPKWFQPSRLWRSLQTKHISASFRKNILLVFSFQGNTLKQAAYSW